MGLSVVVHNGSTLFSGDAGSGESAIRKYFLDQDWVEAIIQMPTDEFFNTGIYTYLWIFNKNKSAERKDKVMLINACDLYVPLKKSKGKKRKEMDLENRIKIVNALIEFKDNEFSKVFDKWYFYFNKQSIQLTNVDYNGKAIAMPIKKDKDGELKEEKSIKLRIDFISQKDGDNSILIEDVDIVEFDNATYKDLEDYYETFVKPQIAALDYKEKILKVSTEKGKYWYDANKDTIINEINDKPTELGCGKIIIKASLKKANKTNPACISITAEITQDIQKDYEIIPYCPTEADNQQTIDNFMAKYITKPFTYLDKVVGVEINFNKVFYKPELLEAVSTISAKLEALEIELKELERELGI